MTMHGRNFLAAGGDYRYGYNGKENDNEVKGEGNQQDYGMRIYDPRLGRFLSVDPIAKKYPELTPFQFASNRPIDGIDQDGLEHQQVNTIVTKQWSVVKTTDVSNFIYDVGPAGWGTKYVFYDESGKLIKTYFTPSDPPIIWSGANRPLYVNGTKIAGDYTSGDGPDSSPIYGAESGVQVTGQLGNTRLSATAKVNDTGGSSKEVADIKGSIVTGKPKVEVQAKAFLKINLQKPSSDIIKINQSIPIDIGNIQATINMSGDIESVEFNIGKSVGVDKSPSSKNPAPQVKAEKTIFTTDK